MLPTSFMDHRSEIKFISSATTVQDMIYTNQTIQSYKTNLTVVTICNLSFFEKIYLSQQATPCYWQSCYTPLLALRYTMFLTVSPAIPRLVRETIKTLYKYKQITFLPVATLHQGPPGPGPGDGPWWCSVRTNL